MRGPWRSARRCLLGALLAALPACGEGSGGPRIEREDIRIEPGIAGVFARDSWNLLRVEVENQGDEFRGVLEVAGESDFEAEPVAYRIPFEIPGRGRAKRRAELPVYPAGWERVRVTLRDGGFERTFRRELTPDDDVRLRVLLTGDAAVDSIPLQDEIARCLKEAGDLAAGRIQSRVSQLAPSEFPVHAAALDPFGLVVLWGTALLDSDPGALRALEDWVEGGGTLVAFPGPEWGAGLPAEFLALLGVTPSDPEAPLSEAVAVERGAGRVFTLSHRPQGRRFPSVEEVPALHRALRPALKRALSFAGDPSTALRALEGVSPQVLRSLSGFRPPPRSRVILGVCAYIALGFFLPALILKRLRRREWTFPAVAIAAGLATWGIYGYGLLSGLERTEIEELSVLRVHADGKRAEATCFLGIISPALTRLDLEPPEGRLRPLRGETWNRWGQTAQLPVPPTVLDAGKLGQLGARGVVLHPNALRFLRFNGRVPLEPIASLEARGSEAGAPPGLRLKNNGAEPIRLYLLQGERYAFLEDVPPGGEGSLPAESRLALSKIPDFLYFPFFFGRSPDHSKTHPGWPKDLEDGSSLALLFWSISRPEEYFADPVRLLARRSRDQSRTAGELAEGWRRHETSYLVALTRGSAFPEAGLSATRKGIVLMVREIPPEGER